MRHAGDINLYHQIVRQISVDVGPVGASNEIRRFREVIFEPVECRTAKKLPHPLSVSLALLIIHEIRDCECITLAAGCVGAAEETFKRMQSPPIARWNVSRNPGELPASRVAQCAW